MSTKLFVGNLSFKTTENDLQDAFAGCGTVVETNIMMDRMTGRPRGFAFVTMSTKEGAESAINALHSKDWKVFAGADAPSLDFVFTVCDNAAGETCPVWPGQPMTAHWGVADPSLSQGTDEQVLKAFRDTATVLKRRIELMLALPIQALDRISLQQAVDRIGRE